MQDVLAMKNMEELVSSNQKTCFKNKAEERMNASFKYTLLCRLKLNVLMFEISTSILSKTVPCFYFQ